jgi:SAM-dependent methyltransferase
LLVAWATVGALAIEREFTPWSVVAPIIAERGVNPPPELEHASEGLWNAWARKRDKAIRARLEQGDLDSMVNLLLFGTSFTRQPRIRIENITQAARSGVLRGRVDDLITGLKNPGGNERLVFLKTLMRSRGFDANASSSDLGVFVYSNLQRVLQERETLAARAAEARRDADSVLDRSSFFRDRGVSLDTSILPDFSIEQTLGDLKTRGVLREGRVYRAAVIGPGLDFIDKNEESSYDYYPPQTVQPLALYDSLVRLELSKPGALSVSILDISAQVLDHVKRARDRARRNMGYVIQLPRDVARPWPSDLVAYWSALGDRIGAAVTPIPPPEIFKGLETRAVRVRPEVVLACEPVDLDIVLERLKLPQADRFDLVIGTNIFLYYDQFQQLLALENIGAMVKPGGLLLTNDQLPHGPGNSMRQAGITVVRYKDNDPGAVEAIGWYRKD